MKWFLTVFILFLAAAGAAEAQSPATGASQSDTKQPDVFLDNHRPLNQKKEKAPTSRTVSGTVTDDTGQPLEGALVTLTESKTNETKTFFTKKDGKYLFTDLAFTEDYEVKAKWKKLISEPRKLSQYDHNAKVVRLLQVGTPEGYSASSTAAAGAKKEDPKK
jgi:Carboxypeptidase regulatory-like domain